MKNKLGRVLERSGRRFTWLITLMLLGVVLLAASSFIPNAKPKDTGSTKQQEEAVPTGYSNEDTAIRSAERALEERLETVLEQVKNVGSVSVTVSLKTGPEYQYAANVNTNQREIEENDTNGGQRVTRETTREDQLVLAQAASMGIQEPVVIKELKPQIEGVLVVAEGAVNSTVKADISRAVQTLLGIPAHTVSVLPKNVER